MCVDSWVHYWYRPIIKTRTLHDPRPLIHLQKERERGRETREKKECSLRGKTLHLIMWTLVFFTLETLELWPNWIQENKVKWDGSAWWGEEVDTSCQGFGNSIGIFSPFCVENVKNEEKETLWPIQRRVLLQDVHVDVLLYETVEQDG